MPDLLQAIGTVTIQAAEGQKPTAQIMAYSGGLMTVPGWGPVAINLAGLDVAAGVAVLADHDTTIRGFIGQGSASIRSNQLHVAAQLTITTEAGAKVVQLSKEGFTFQASVGVQPSKSQHVPAGNSVTVNGRTIQAPSGGFVLIEAGLLREVTICVLGCDPNTNVAIAAMQKGLNVLEGTEGGTPSTPIQTIQQQTPIVTPTVQASADPIAAFRAQQAGEIERVRRIQTASASYGEQVVEVNGEEMSLAAHAIQAGWSSSQYELEALRRARPTVGAPVPTTSGAITPKHLEAAMLVRAGYSAYAEKMLGERIMEDSRRLHSASLVDMCRAALRMDGGGLHSHMSKDELLRASFTSSTGSMPVAFGNAMNKSMSLAFTEGAATWRSFCAIRPAANFKTHTSLRPNFIGELEQVGANGEIRSATYGEDTINWSIDTYAKKIGFNRQTMVNDDLSVLDEVAPAFSRASLRRIADLVYSTLINAGSHFSAGNKNLIDGGSGTEGRLGVDPLGVAIRMMRTQRDAKNNDLDIQPAVLLVAGENETAGKAALESEFIERAVNEATGNPMRKAVKLEVESRLSNTAKFVNANAAHWFLFARPLDVPMLVGFLDGKQAPTIEFFGLDSDINMLGVSWRVYIDFGVALGEKFAAVKSDGQAAA